MPDVNSQVFKMLDGVIANGVGQSFKLPRGTPYRAFQATIEGSGAVSATVTVEGSIDGVNWVPSLATMSLTGTDSDVKGGEDVAPYPELRGRVASISGTGATVNLWAAI